MPKRILLIGGNFSPEPTGIGKYNGEMIQWLAENGYECTVITTQPYYPYWKVQKPYTNRWFVKEKIATTGKPITVYRCPQYVPRNPSGKQRLVQEVSFAASSFLCVVRMLAKQRFDFVINVVPPIQLGLHAWLYKQLRGAKFLYHIQDLQVEAARDLQMIRSKTILNGLFRFEKFVLDRADSVSSISPGMIRKIQSKIDKEVTSLPNWVDLKSFFPLDNPTELRQEFGFSETDKLILYSGAIGEKQGLELILDCAAALQANTSVKFLICGSGPYKEKLQGLAREKQLSNLVFLPLQPKESFNAFLNMADIHLVIQKKGASDLVMPSKLTTILSVGGASLITAEKGSSLYDLVQEHEAGRVVEPESRDAFTRVLQEMLQQDLSPMKKKARQYAEQHLCIDAILTEYCRNLN